VAADPLVDGARTARAVRDYYERNTRFFLSLGIGAKTLAMRRAVWAAGVENLRQAVDHVNTLVAAEIRALGRPRGGGDRAKGASLRVLDIGCGVGGSLLFLCRAVGEALQGVGVTISPRQAEIASRQARLRGLARQLSFVAGDFCALAGQSRFHCAFAIESFVHFPAPHAFFEAAARSLEPGGHLVVVDDFLSEERHPPREQRLVDAFRRGWVLSSLCTVDRAALSAAEAGLRLVDNRDLSPFLRQLPPAPPALRALALLVAALPVPWSYWRSTAGSLALAACQKARLVQYRCLVFEKTG